MFLSAFFVKKITYEKCSEVLEINDFLVYYVFKYPKRFRRITMEKKEKVLSPVKLIGGGVKLNHHKNAAETETVRFVPEKVSIPLSQHIGAPCTACVNVGDKVYLGTKIADSESYVSAPIHSSVSGTVTAIEKRNVSGRETEYISIESDGNKEWDKNLKPYTVNTREDIISAARECGLVGLGGAGFPTHVKLSPPKNAEIDTLIINAAECEPYITADYRECMENYSDVLDGIYLVKKIYGIKNVVICVESNKPKAIRKLYNMASDKRDSDDTVKLMKLPSSYPQGAEKVIIYSATGRVLPVGKLPSDVGCIVMNVTSVGSLYRFIRTGHPLTHKRVTVDGTAVRKPMNIFAPIGSYITDILDFVGEIDDSYEKVITGGPMMGSAVADKDAVIDKRTNAVLVMKPQRQASATPCIRCGRCADHCPMGLFPQKVETANRVGDTEEYKLLNINNCMECGICSYVCPAKRPLTQVMRVAKAELRRNAK